MTLAETTCARGESERLLSYAYFAFSSRLVWDLTLLDYSTRAL